MSHDSAAAAATGDPRASAELALADFDRAMAVRPDRQRDAAAMLRRIGREVWDSLRHDLPRTLRYALVGAAVAYAGNAVLLAVVYHGNGAVPAGSAATAPGSRVSGSIFWALTMAMVCTLVSYRLNVGGKLFWRGVRNFPATPARLLRADGRGALGNLLWGYAGAMLVALLLSPALSGVLAVGVVLIVGGLLRMVVTGMVALLWAKLFGSVSRRAARGVGDSAVSVGMLGAVVALIVAIFASATLVKLIIAVVAAVAALLLSRLGARDGGGGAPPGRIATGLPVGIVAILLALMSSGITAGACNAVNLAGHWTAPDISSDVLDVQAEDPNTGACTGYFFAYGFDSENPDDPNHPGTCQVTGDSLAFTANNDTIHGTLTLTGNGGHDGEVTATETGGPFTSTVSRGFIPNLGGASPTCSGVSPSGQPFNPYLASLLGGVFGLGGSLFGPGLGRALSAEEQQQIALRQVMAQWRQQNPNSPWDDFWQGPRLVGAQQGFYKAADDQAQGMIDMKARFDHFTSWLTSTPEGQQLMDDPLHSEQSRDLSQWLINFPQQGVPQAVLDQVSALQDQIAAIQAAEQRGDLDTAENLKGQLLGNALWQLYVMGLMGRLGPEGELVPPEEPPPTLQQWMEGQGITREKVWMRENYIKSIGPVLDADGNPIESRNVVIKIVYDDGSAVAFKPQSGEKPLTVPELGDTAKMNRELANSILAQALGNDQVPLVVMLDHPELGQGSAMKWVPYKDVESISQFSVRDQQMAAVQDYITGNIDRHFGNLGAGENGLPVTPDGGETFPETAPRARTAVSEFVAQQINQPLSEDVLKAVQSIDQDALRANLAKAGLNPEQIDGAIARLNEISENGKITGQSWTSQGGFIQSRTMAGPVLPAVIVKADTTGGVLIQKFK